MINVLQIHPDDLRVRVRAGIRPDHLRLPDGRLGHQPNVRNGLQKCLDTHLYQERLEKRIITSKTKSEATHHHIEDEHQRRCIRTSFNRALGRIVCSSAVDHYYSSESTGSFLVAQ